jgi:hypothetical protein
VFLILLYYHPGDKPQIPRHATMRDKLHVARTGALLGTA